MKFSKGDRIRSISPFRNGKDGVVSANLSGTAQGGLFSVEVYLDGDIGKVFFNEDELEVIKTGLDLMLELL